MQYPHIFTPGRIGTLVTTNRIKYAATETNFPFGDGFVSDREVAYMEAQAQGGAGIVTTQGAYMDERGEGKGFKGMMAAYDDRFIPGLSRIAEVIKKNGALSCFQLLHCGREGGVDLDYCLMPSVVPQKLSYFKPPREISVSQIRQSVIDHVRAARRAVDAGFDMIEISGIVGYLLSTFISRYTNKRQDGYGGNIRSRCRLMVEVLGAVKAEVGKNVPVGIRLCGLELLDDRGGNTLEESLESFRIAEEAGADYLSVTIGWHESSVPVITRDVPMGHWLWVAGKVKEAAKVPVMMAFRQFTPDVPEEAIASGTIDFWEACRPMIADPGLPRKIAEKKESEIIPCIACNLCFSRLYFHQPLMCSVRPTLGHEGETSWGYRGFAPAGRKKKVIVVGGGPAGLQCAAVAAQRGHKVTLWEKSAHVGGALLLASQVDEGAEELLRPVQYLEDACLKAGVELRTGYAATSEALAGEEADAIVITSGATESIPPGAGALPVFSPGNIIAGGITPSGNILILGGDGVALGVAVFLLRKGGAFNLFIVEEGAKLGRDVNPFYLWGYMRRLKEGKATLLRGCRLLAIDGTRARVSGAKGETILDVNAIVAAQRKPADWWSGALQGSKKEIYVAGDAKRPRRLNNAIHDGFRVGITI
ncbi:MAG TPA: FAD-dependent oxidoreductase [Syntrophorhabdales bacterium]|nr:FAD-dependent oxidoreductase [Syntrophorhabdales bacterium]